MGDLLHLDSLGFYIFCAPSVDLPNDPAPHLSIVA